MMKPKFDLKNILEQLKENPVRIFGLVYPYILVIGIGIGVYYLGAVNNIARQKVPPLLPDTTIVGDLKVVEAKSVPPVDIHKVGKPTPELIAKGKTLFSANCSSCHGEEGTGTGPASVGLNPAPRNFTVKENWKNGSTLTGIYQTLQAGIPGSGMIPYDFIIPEERIALAHYIRTTFVQDTTASTQDELTALDLTYNLSKGTEIPAQIPVTSAIEIIATQKNETQKNISALVSQIEMMSVDGGSRIFLNITADPVKALTSLNNTKNWKQSEENFVKSVIANVNQNGFKGSVYNLSKSEWTTLYDFLSRML